MPELSKTPQANQMALVKLSDSSFCTWFRPESRVSNRPKGEKRSRRYKHRATTCTETKTSTHRVDLNGCKNETNWDALGCCNLHGFFSKAINAFLFLAEITLFCKIVIPWYLKGLLNSITWARSGLMVKGATMRSAYSCTNWPIKPFQSCFPVLLLRSRLPYSLKDKCRL